MRWGAGPGQMRENPPGYASTGRMAKAVATNARQSYIGGVILGS